MARRARVGRDPKEEVTMDGKKIHPQMTQMDTDEKNKEN
jgi:hypothetical protein